MSLILDMIGILVAGRKYKKRENDSDPNNPTLCHIDLFSIDRRNSV